MRHLSRLKEEYVDIQVPLAAIECVLTEESICTCYHGNGLVHRLVLMFGARLLGCFYAMTSHASAL